MDSDTNENIAQGGEGVDHKSSLTSEGDWSVMPEPDEYGSLGFLQMCIERRFHQSVQQKFQDVAGLRSTDYWIHTGIGGSPGMRDQHEAPDYCVGEGATVMGWAAHGSDCGGFPDLDDDDIRDLLSETLVEKTTRYPGLTHHLFFARDGDLPGEVKVWHLNGKR